MFPISNKLPFEIWLLRHYPDDTFLPSDYLLFCVMSGPLKITIDSTDFVYFEGDLFLIQPGEIYHVDPDDRFFCCILRMDFHFILRCCNYKKPVFLASSQKRLLSLQGNPPLISQLKEKLFFLTDVFFSRPREVPAKMTYYFYDFAYFFIENFQLGSEETPAPTKAQRAYVITDYIESNYNSPITLNGLSAELGLTPQYLSGFIRKNMGTTFNTLLYDVRFKHVLVDLVETSQDITRIILNNGFPNTSGFNKMFRQRYHMTPTEYRQKKWQGDSTFKQFPQHLFSLENDDLYDTFAKIRQRQKEPEHDRPPIKAYLDCTKTSWFPNPFNQLMNLKEARQLLSFEYLYQLNFIQSHIPYKYARIEKLIHPDILGEPTPDTSRSRSRTECHFNYASMDALMDQLHRLSLIPWIVLCPEKDNGFFAVGRMENVVRAVLIHAIDRYGLTYVSQWKIEVAQADFQTSAQYISYAAPLFHAIKLVGSRICCGGPLFALDRPYGELCDILDGWFLQQTRPDFITLSVYPYVQNRSVSQNPEVNLQRLAQLFRAIKQHTRLSRFAPDEEIPLYITDFGFTRAKNSYINDTVFIAAYALHNFIGMKEYAKIIAWPALSDITAVSVPSEKLLIGGSGMLTVNSLFKPVFFALRYLAGMGEKLLDSGKGRMITINSNNDVVILLYNYVHPDAFYCPESSHAIALEHIHSFYENAPPVQFDIHLTRLEASRYQMVKFRLNKDYGSILDVWAASGEISRLRNETLNYLRQTLAPKAEFCEIENNGEVVIRETVAAQEILSIIINPLH